MRTLARVFAYAKSETSRDMRTERISTLVSLVHTLIFDRIRRYARLHNPMWFILVIPERSVAKSKRKKDGELEDIEAGCTISFCLME